MKAVPVITMTRVSRSVGRDVLAVNDMRLTTHQGDCITLMGPSGAENRRR